MFPKGLEMDLSMSNLSGWNEHRFSVRWLKSLKVWHLSHDCVRNGDDLRFALPFGCFNKVDWHLGCEGTLTLTPAFFFLGKNMVYDVHLSNNKKERLLGIPYNQCKFPSWLVPKPVTKPASKHTRRNGRNRGNGCRMPVEKPIGEVWCGFFRVGCNIWKDVGSYSKRIFKSLQTTKKDLACKR